MNSDGILVKKVIDFKAEAEKAVAGEKGDSHDAAADVGVMEEQWHVSKEMLHTLELVNVNGKAKAKFANKLCWMRATLIMPGVLLKRFDDAMAKF